MGGGGEVVCLRRMAHAECGLSLDELQRASAPFDVRDGLVRARMTRVCGANFGAQLLHMWLCCGHFTACPHL